MAFLDSAPVWLLSLLIFVLRIVDVSLGTIRTITVVNGRIRASVALGFFEILIWVAVVAQVISRVNQSPVLILAYAAGFAAGNGVGILLERLFALGSCVVRIISMTQGPAIAERLRADGQRLTTFVGQGQTGEHLLIYFTCTRRDLGQLIKTAKSLDPSMFYVVEPVSESSHLVPLPHSTGWRSTIKKK